MTTFNREMSKEEALELYKSKDGMSYPDTPHNRKIMKEVVDEHLKSLHQVSPLMNIDSERLCSCPFDEDINIEDEFHTKGETITDYGRTWEVTRVTSKQVHAVAKDFWYPVFENTAFGRVAEGEDEDRLAWAKEWTGSQKGKLTRSFWKTGEQVGFKDRGCVHVVVIDKIS